LVGRGLLKNENGFAFGGTYMSIAKLTVNADADSYYHKINELIDAIEALEKLHEPIEKVPGHNKPDTQDDLKENIQQLEYELAERRKAHSYLLKRIGALENQYTSHFHVKGTESNETTTPVYLEPQPDTQDKPYYCQHFDVPSLTRCNHDECKPDTQDEPKKRRMVGPSGIEHYECPDCRGECSPVEPKEHTHVYLNGRCECGYKFNPWTDGAAKPEPKEPDYKDMYWCTACEEWREVLNCLGNPSHVVRLIPAEALRAWDRREK
jgi:hypothetical protein